MQDNEEKGDPRLNEAQKALGLRLAEYRNNDPRLSARTVREMNQIARDFRETCKRKGIDMPKLKVVAFVAMNHVCVWPEELSPEEIQKRMRMFVIHRQRHGIAVDTDDMARGVRRAYPDYSPSRFTIACPQPAQIQ